MTADQHAPLARVRDVAARPDESFALDPVDLALLKILITDARTSQRQISTLLGVSAPTVGERMARLERAGVITGYGAQVNWSALGYGQIVFLSIEAAPGCDIAAIMTALWDIAEVEDVTLLTGELDLLVRTRVRDHNHLRTILMDQIWQIPGTQRTRTMLSVARMPAKDFGAGLLNRIEETDAAETIRPKLR